MLENLMELAASSIYSRMSRRCFGCMRSCRKRPFQLGYNLGIGLIVWLFLLEIC